MSKLTLSVVEYRGATSGDRLEGWLGLSPANQRRVCHFLALLRRARIVFFQPQRLTFHAAACLRESVLPEPRARLLMGFVLDEVRREDFAAR